MAKIDLRGGTENVEYNDNRIALYVAQKGRCAVTKTELYITERDFVNNT